MGRLAWCAVLLAGSVELGAGFGCVGVTGDLDSTADLESGSAAGGLHYPVLSWLYDPACNPPRADDARRVEQALALWSAYWSVTIEPEPVPGAPIVAVCLMDEWPDSQHSGLSYGPDLVTMQARIEAWRGVERRRYMTGLIAHELGHVILNSPGMYLRDHLPDDVEGIMNPSVDCQGEGDECLWSAGDIEHLEAFGLIYDPTAELPPV